jgi:hypothetical protein
VEAHTGLVSGGGDERRRDVEPDPAEIVARAGNTGSS